MIKVECIKCGAELKDPGALAFGPPHGETCIKLHLCKKCWRLFLAWLGLSEG